MASKIFVVTHESIDVPQGEVFAPIAAGQILEKAFFVIM